MSVENCLILVEVAFGLKGLAYSESESWMSAGSVRRFFPSVDLSVFIPLRPNISLIRHLRWLATNKTLVEIQAVGIYGSDMHAYLGHDPRRVSPLILGHEAGGEVLDGPFR